MKLKTPSPEETAAELLAALQRLLNCCELNMDDMEDDTRSAIDQANEAVANATIYS